MMKDIDKSKLREAFEYAITNLPKVDVPVPYERLEDGTPMTYRKLWESCMESDDFYEKAEKKLLIDKISIDDLANTIKQGFYPRA